MLYRKRYREYENFLDIPDGQTGIVRRKPAESFNVPFLDTESVACCIRERPAEMIEGPGELILLEVGGVDFGKDSLLVSGITEISGAKEVRYVKAEDALVLDDPRRIRIRIKPQTRVSIQYTRSKELHYLVSRHGDKRVVTSVASDPKSIQPSDWGLFPWAMIALLIPLLIFYVVDYIMGIPGAGDFIGLVKALIYLIIAVTATSVAALPPVINEYKYYKAYKNALHDTLPRVEIPIREYEAFKTGFH